MKNKVTRLKLGIADAFLIKDKTIALVDTGIHVRPEKYQQVFAKNQIQPADINLIIITHGHSDHFAHLKYLKQITNAKILCHQKAEEHLLNGTNPPLQGRNLLGKILMKFFSGKVPNYQGIKPDMVIESNTDLRELGIQGELLVTPGHSDCSLTILLDTGETIIGDMLMPVSLLNRQIPDLAIFVNNTLQLAKSLQDILKTHASLFYGSHGGEFPRENVKKMLRKYL
ncbi:MAG: MBL fold metallo-hydrolase [Spirochaetes bacterium]|nr:MBL fold metallo-hydrolase [Spirochaetota bacterium]